MKRYDAMHDNDYVSTDRRESPTGQYVLATDVAALEAERDRLESTLLEAESILGRLTWSGDSIYDGDIEYVRRDGVCFWRYEYDQIDDAETGGCYRPTSHGGGASSMDWAWCPYCGKRIRLEEA